MHTHAHKHTYTRCYSLFVPFTRVLLPMISAAASAANRGREGAREQLSIANSCVCMFERKRARKDDERTTKKKPEGDQD